MSTARERQVIRRAKAYGLTRTKASPAGVMQSLGRVHGQASALARQAATLTVTKQEVYALAKAIRDVMPEVQNLVLQKDKVAGQRIMNDLTYEVKNLHDLVNNFDGTRPKVARFVIRNVQFKLEHLINNIKRGWVF